MENNNIKCRICEKEIEYNENGICEDCQKKIIEKPQTKKVRVFCFFQKALIIVILLIVIISISLNVFFIKDVATKNRIINENAYKYTDNLLDYEPTIVVAIEQAFIDESIQAVEVETNGKYTGNRLNGKNTGNGTYVWNNGDIYEGEFENDLMHGTGKLSIVGKGTYEGKFVKGKKSGIGTYTFVNGDVYIGEWLDDKMNGEGTYTFANGDKYSGNFSNNMFNGYGTYTKNGQSYSGTWKNNSYNK